MVTFNRHVGMTVEECYKQHEDIIYALAKKSKGALKDIYSMDMEDLYQIATIGFLNAYNDFIGDFNTKFSSYAHSRIKWELYNALKKRHTVHFPNAFYVIWNLMAKYNSSHSNVQELKERKPKEISDTTVDLAVIWAGKATPTSLDKPVSNEIHDDKAQELYDVIVGSTTDESIVIVTDFLDELNDKQATIVKLLLEDKTQVEIAKEMCLSQSQVSRNIKAIQKLWLAYTEEADV